MVKSKLEVRGAIMTTILFVVAYIAVLLHETLHSIDLKWWMLVVAAIAFVNVLIFPQVFPKNRHWKRYRPILIITGLLSVMLLVSLRFVLDKVMVGMLFLGIWIHAGFHILNLYRSRENPEMVQTIVRSYARHQWYLMIVLGALVNVRLFYGNQISAFFNGM
jgi:hypothetical protein